MNISNDDIVDGNPKLTLGLMWYIISHFQVRLSHCNEYFYTIIYFIHVVRGCQPLYWGQANEEAIHVMVKIFLLNNSSF